VSSDTECSGSDMVGELLRGRALETANAFPNWTPRAWSIGPEFLSVAEQAAHRLIVVCQLEPMNEFSRRDDRTAESGGAAKAIWISGGIKSKWTTQSISGNWASRSNRRRGWQAVLSIFRKNPDACNVRVSLVPHIQSCPTFAPLRLFSSCCSLIVQCQHSRRQP
jgi:hypothetical protein